jgi:dGTPase
MAHMNDFGAIVAAASLAHDIRNPPLDIQVKKRWRYFPLEMEKRQRQMSKKQWQDLIDFEGNANGFF